MVRSLIDTDRDKSTPKTSMSYRFSIDFPSGLDLLLPHGSCSTIANIANRAPVSTYISQVIGHHPTSTGLSMAKHIFDPGPIPVKGVIAGQGIYMH